MILISIIHTIAVFFGYTEVLENMSEYWAISHQLWFGAAGMLFLFIGTVDLLSYSGLKEGKSYAWRFAFCSSVFPAVLGPIGTYIFRNDPTIPVFPILIMILGFVSFTSLLISGKNYTAV
ncbi:MAG: hypothetical protein JXA20_07115 [Spirochaetes bacterium]|nr:hypothetical protein [Spirochaetota bacterium]